MTLTTKCNSLAPSLLEQLKNSTEPIPKSLDASTAAQADPIPKLSFVDNEAAFRWALLEDACAFEKLHDGIKKFAEDAATLKGLLRKRLQS